MFRTLALLAVVMTVSCASALSGIRDTSLLLTMQRGHCSGTAVGRNIVLSAEHCWANGNRLVAINGQEAHALKIVRDGKDHVLVRVTTKFTRWSQMGPEPEQGDRVRWIGNPSSLRGQFREGYITGTYEGEFLIDARVFGGDSGSGIYNDRGQLVGVVSGMRRWSTREGFDMQLMVSHPLAFSAEDWRAIR